MKHRFALPEMRKGSEVVGDETVKGKQGLPRAPMTPHTGRCHTPRCSPHPPTGPILKTLEGHLCVHCTGASGRQRAVSVGRGPLGLLPVTLDGAALLRDPELGCPQAPLRPRVTPLPALGLSSPPPCPQAPSAQVTPTRWSLPPAQPLHPQQVCPHCPPCPQACSLRPPEHSIRWAGDGIPAPCTSRLLRRVCLFS